MAATRTDEPVRDDTRTRLIDTTATLLQTQGYHGTGLNQILAEAHAPRGSLYFHFPGGKEQLALEAMESSRATIMRWLGSAFDRPGTDFRAGLKRFIDLFAKQLEQSDYTRGCPVATVALESSGLPESLRLACEQTYRDECAFVAERLAPFVPRRSTATRLARMIQSVVLGGVVLAKAHRSTAPLRDAAAQLDALIATLAAAAPRARHRTPRRSTAVRPRQP